MYIKGSLIKIFKNLLRNKYLFKYMLEAKCYKCDKKAEVNDEMSEVNCSYCSAKISYEEYLEIMKEKALNMGIEFQNNWDKNPFS